MKETGINMMSCAHNIVCSPFHHLSERQHSFDQGSSPLGCCPSSSVLHMDIIITDIYNHRVAITHIRNLVPPICQPVLHAGVSSPCFQTFLQLSNLSGFEELLDGRLGGGEFGGG